MKRIPSVCGVVGLVLAATVVSVVPTAGPAFAVDSSDIITTIVEPIPNSSDSVMSMPSDVAVGPDGTIYIADTNKNRIRQVDTDGVASTFAGKGWNASSGDGGPAIDAAVSFPSSVDVDGQGNVYFNDNEGHKIRKVDTNGIISTVAGNGEPGRPEEGSPALETTVAYPKQVAVSNDGRVFFTSGYQIFAINSDGLVFLVAGTGELGVSGDGGPATEAEFWGINSIAAAGDGSLYVASAAQVRRVDANGIISTVAGTGEPGDLSEDGVLATDARIPYVSGLAIADDLTIYFSGNREGRVYKIDSAGLLQTVGGGGTSYNDNIPASSAKLYWPGAIAVDQYGSLLIVEPDRSLLRKIAAPDVEKPTISISAPSNGQHLSVGDSQMVSFRCDDAYTGVATCTARMNGNAISDGDAIGTSQPGQQTLLVTAVDAAGNARTKSVSLTVDAPPTTTTAPTTTEPSTTTPSTTAPSTTASSTSTTTTAPSTTTTSTTTPTTTTPSTTTPSTTVPEPKSVDPRIITGRFAKSSGDQAAIARLYVAIMARQPEAAGHQYWTEQTHNGTTIRDIASYFIVSPEFEMIYGKTTDEQFIELLYRNVMARNPDTDGQDYWVSALASGVSRLEVTVLFSQSDEFMIYTQTT